MPDQQTRSCYVVRKVTASFDGHAPSREEVVAVLSDRSLADVVFALIGDGSVREDSLPLSVSLSVQIAFGDTLARTLCELSATQRNLLDSLRQLVPPDIR